MTEGDNIDTSRTISGQEGTRTPGSNQCEINSFLTPSQIELRNQLKIFHGRLSRRLNARSRSDRAFSPTQGNLDTAALLCSQKIICTGPCVFPFRTMFAFPGTLRPCNVRPPLCCLSLLMSREGHGETSSSDGKSISIINGEISGFIKLTS
ncbi:hypothetical protein RRG08_017011 [Elysia crispata]|uniref:Uncharacterized protein n=1 Tax=Elysia crispata TaxID=231223 RepID=A0AAE0XZB9_9GAST|nr:hypothetical protein RRG08_017011 [Elysia crispata]